MGISIQEHFCSIYIGAKFVFSFDISKNFEMVVIDILFTHIFLFIWRSFCFILRWERTLVGLSYQSFKLAFFATGFIYFKLSIIFFFFADFRNCFLDKHEEKLNEFKFELFWWLGKVNESVKKFWRNIEIGGLTVLRSWKVLGRVHFCGKILFLWRRLTEFEILTWI